MNGTDSGYRKSEVMGKLFAEGCVYSIISNLK
jgi:hypothetical protein